MYGGKCGIAWRIGFVDREIVKITENTSCKTDGTECVALGPPNKTSDTVECKHGDL